jgi:hypothetical protein
MANRVITREYALTHLRGQRNPYAVAIGLIRRLDSWGELAAVLSALDEVAGADLLAKIGDSRPGPAGSAHGEPDWRPED